MVDYLDELAFPEDGPWSSGLWRKMRASVERIGDLRKCRAAYSEPGPADPAFGTGSRLHTFEPAPICLGVIYQAEPFSTITLRLSIITVELQGAAVGRNAVDLYAESTGAYQGDDPGRPPVEWPVVLRSGEDDRVATIPVVNRASERGPVVVWLWLKSRLGGLADSGSGVKTFARGRRELANLGTALSNPPERVLVIGQNIAGKPIAVEETSLGQEQCVAFRDVGGQDDEVFVHPDHPGSYGFDDSLPGELPLNWELYYQGIVEIGGFDIEAAGMPDLPAIEGYRTGRPTIWQQHQPLVGALETLVQQRVPTWRTKADNAGLRWRWLTSGPERDLPSLSTANNSTADYQTLLTVPVPLRVPNANGYEAHLMFVPISYRSRGSAQKLRFRLVVRRMEDLSVVTTGDETEIDASPQLFLGDPLNQLPFSEARTGIWQLLELDQQLDSFNWFGWFLRPEDRALIHHVRVPIQDVGVPSDLPHLVDIQARAYNQDAETVQMDCLWVNVALYNLPKAINSGIT